MTNWKNIIKITLVTGISVYIIGMFLFGDGIGKSFGFNTQIFGIYLMYALVMSLANGYFFKYIQKVFPRESGFNKQLVYGFLGSIVLSIIILIVLRYVVEVIIYNQEPSNFLEGSKTYFYFGISLTIIIVLLFYVFYFYRAIVEKKVTESQVVAKTEIAKYESLKSQLDPHFLFNSLNVLTSLIGENPTLAEKFTTKLSRIYRYVLEQKSKDLISLQEELTFAKTYMELLKMRFEDAVIFDIPETISNSQFKIVPLSLQLLLENAIKHNVINSAEPLQIKIYEEENYLVVKNNLNEKTNLSNSTKVGLKNILDRYNLITKKKVIIEKNNKSFIVKIPLLTQKISTMINDKKEANKYLRAKKRVEEMKEFYSSLISYLIVIPFLIFIWYRYTPYTIQWFWFPMFGWGIGLVFQGFKAFGNPLLGMDWEERKIKEIMDSDQKQFWE